MTLPARQHTSRPTVQFLTPMYASQNRIRLSEPITSNRENRMKLPSVLCFVTLATVAPALAQAADKDPPVETPARSVKIEVTGKLTAAGNGYAVRTADVFFPNVEVLVHLQRSEDKNRPLDALLKSLEGKTVIVTGYLDCRRLSAEKSEIHIYVSKENQINAVKEK